jgi:hypothetical protein
MERYRKKNVVVNFDVISRNLSGGTGENPENPQSVTGLRAEILTPKF